MIDEKEIGEEQKRIACNIPDFIGYARAEGFFEGHKDGFIAGAKWAQSKMFGQASDGWEGYKDRLTSGGNYQVNRLDLHAQTWQAAYLAAQKKHEDEIKKLKAQLEVAREALKRCLSPVATGKREHILQALATIEAKDGQDGI